MRFCVSAEKRREEDKTQRITLDGKKKMVTVKNGA
jgi:hypothetical protein